MLEFRQYPSGVGKMLRCEHCDHFNLPDAKNCERCGAPLAASIPEEQPAGPSAPGGSGLEARILEIARTQGKIQAIKHYREVTGAGLKEAKDAVEAMILRHGVKVMKSGCATSVLLFAVAGLVAWHVLGRMS
jgi:ribosomal protein L7/L12